MGALKNFAIATVAQGYDDTATSIDVTSGGSAKLSSDQPAWWWNSTDYANPADDPNVEIVLIGTITGDTAIPITRAQEGTSASTKNIADKVYKIAQGLTAGRENLLVDATSAFGADNVLLKSDGTGRRAQATGITVDDSDNVSGVENLDAQTITPEQMLFAEGSAPATPASGKVALYAKTDGLLYSKDDAGVETLVSGGAGGGGGSGVVEIVSATGAPHTLAAANVGKLVQVDDAVTVPANATEAIAVGSVMLIQRVGAGAVTITPEGGVTVNPSGGPWAIALQHGIIGLHKTATDTWTIFGEYA